MMSYVIWGTGRRGKNLYQYFKEDIVAFIESDSCKIGSAYNGVSIIGFDEYLARYRNLPIMISPYKEQKILDILKKENIDSTLRSNACPIEFVDNYYPELFYQILKKVNGKNKIYIVGVSLLSIWLTKQFSSFDYTVELVDTDDLDRINEDNGTIVLDASGKRDVFIEDKIITKEWVDIFHLGNMLPNFYRNLDIEKFKDAYKNRRCFIIATGPSLRMEDLNRLRDHQELCISMNKIFYAFDQTNWVPDFYVGEDVNLIKYYADEIKKVSGVKFLSDSYVYPKDSDEVCYTFHLSVAGEEFRYGGCEDFSWGYPCGYSVIFGCIYLAIYMGFSEIYILGADMNYVGNAGDSENHFYGDKDVISTEHPSVSLPFHSTAVLQNYDYIARFAKQNNVKIYNETRGGKLESFCRVDFDILFKD